jgi:hypothetical protein
MQQEFPTTLLVRDVSHHGAFHHEVSMDNDLPQIAIHFCGLLLTSDGLIVCQSEDARIEIGQFVTKNKYVIPTFTSTKHYVSVQKININFKMI